MISENIHRIPHNCALKLQAVYGKLKTAEKKAADFILQNPDAIFGLSIVEFAERAGCSEATIVRLSKRIGYEGYPELPRSPPCSTTTTFAPTIHRWR